MDRDNEGSRVKVEVWLCSQEMVEAHERQAITSNKQDRLTDVCIAHHIQLILNISIVRGLQYIKNWLMYIL